MDLGPDVALRPAAPRVGDDADDLPRHGLARAVRARHEASELDALGQRIRGAEHPLHEGLVDDGDELAALAVGVSEAAARA